MQRYTLTPTSDKFTPPVDSHLSFTELRFVFDGDPPIARWGNNGEIYLLIGIHHRMNPSLQCRARLDGRRMQRIVDRITIKESRSDSDERLVHLFPYPVGSVILYQILEQPSGQTRTAFLGVEPLEIVPLTAKEYDFLVGGGAP